MFFNFNTDNFLLLFKSFSNEISIQMLEKLTNNIA